MKINHLNTNSDGERTIEISCDELSFRALLRCLRKIPGVAVSNSHHNPMTDDAAMQIHFRGSQFEVYTPFSDYMISNKGPCSDETWNALVGAISDYRVRWWEKLL